MNAAMNEAHDLTVGMLMVTPSPRFGSRRSWLALVYSLPGWTDLDAIFYKKNRSPKNPAETAIES